MPIPILELLLPGGHGWLYRAAYDLGGPGNSPQNSVYDMISPPQKAYQISVYNLVGAMIALQQSVEDLGTGGMALYQTNVYDLQQTNQPMHVGVMPPTSPPW